MPTCVMFPLLKVHGAQNLQYVSVKLDKGRDVLADLVRYQSAEETFTPILGNKRLYSVN